MLPMIQHYLAKANGSLTWNNQWISDFESPWSVFEKIKYLNNANKKDIFELFGTSKINAQKTIIGEANHNLYHLVSMDEKRLFDTLGFNVKQYNNDILYNLAGFLKGGKRYTFSLKELWPNYFRNLFTYCSECLKDGYHSLLHQFEFIHTCPFHQVALNDECPDCNQQFPYILSDTHFESPYTCKCGYCFKKVATKYPLSMQWGKYTTSDLTDNNLIDWLLLNEEEQSQLSYFFIYPFTDKKMYPHLMPLLLNNVKEDSSFESDDIEFRYINSSTNILNLENQNTIHEKHKTSWEPMTHTLTGVSAFDSSRKQIIKELVHTKHDIINAVGRYLKKSILRDHSSCIMRYVSVSKFVDSDLTPICPYAYAYVKWKQALLHIDNYYDVDNKIYSVLNPERVSSLYLFNFDNDPLIQIANACIRSHPILNPERFSHLKWIITHLTGFVSLSLFKSFLDNSTTMSIEDRLHSRSDFFAFRFPNRPNQPFSVITDKGFMKDFKYDIDCPFHTVRLKRKSKNEKSFHPMKIAIEKYNKALGNPTSKN